MAIARNGRPLTRLVLEAFGEERITASDVAEILNVRLRHLARIREASRTAAPTAEDAE
jgi:hypothetical protein